MKLQRQLLALMGALLLVSCTEGGIFQGDGGKRTGSTDGGTTADDDETADTPVNVSGTYYLTCSYINEATETRPESNLGCVVKDKQNNKAKLSDLSIRWDWIYEISDIDRQGVKIIANDLNDNNPTWHAVYDFIGTDSGVVRQVASLTRLQSKVVPKSGGGEITAFDTTVAKASGGKITPAQGTDGIFNEGGPIVTDPVTEP